MDFLNVVMAESLSEHSRDSLGSGFLKPTGVPKALRDEEIHNRGARRRFGPACLVEVAIG
jgi:hypothetical protein